MKTLGNWKTWEKDGLKRVYISEKSWLEEGATGLPTICGEVLNEDEAKFVNERYLNNGTKTFAELFEQVKNNQNHGKIKKTSIKEINKLFAEKKISEIEYIQMMKEARAR